MARGDYYNYWNFELLEEAISDTSCTEKYIYMTGNFSFEHTLTIKEGDTVTIQTDPDHLKWDPICTLQAPDRGRHFIVEGNLTIHNLTLDGSNIGDVDHGGVQVNQDAVFIMQSGSTICNNQNEKGGGVYLSNHATFLLEGGEIHHNIATSEGGGVAVDGAELIMNAGGISHNEALQGGNVVVSGGSNFIIDAESVINNNAAKYGGGIYVSSNGKLTMNSGQITSNKATSGGGVHVTNNSSFIMNNGNITKNKANAYGGGVYNDATSTFTIDKGIVISNKAKSGGGIYTEDYQKIVTSELVYFEGNKAETPYLYRGTYSNIQATHPSIQNFYVLNNFDINYEDSYPLQKFSTIFPDYQLATAIAKAFEANPDDYTYNAELETLKSLTAINCKIQTLENIGALVNLKDLNLSQNQISDLRPLVDQNLTTCNLTNQTLQEETVKVGEWLTSHVLDENGETIPLTTDIGNGEAFENGFIWYEAGNNSLKWNYEGYFSGTIKQQVLKNKISTLFPDKNLAQVIASLLNKGIESSINLNELNWITNLNADNRGIKNLTGIQLIPFLRSLSLNNNLISDLAPLTNLKLTTLRLNHNQISDISPLGSVTYLTTLSLQNNLISNVAALTTLEYLNGLNLSHNEVSDFSDLNFPRLTTLRLEYTQFTDLNKLPLMPSIKNLYLSHNRITSISPLATLLNLKILELNDNPAITTVAELANVTNLFVIELTGNPNIEDIDSLKNLPNLLFLEWDGENEELTSHHRGDAV